MSEKDDPREDRLPACGRTRGKVWTGLGTAILAGAAFSLLPQAPPAGALGKLASPAPDRHG